MQPQGISVGSSAKGTTVLDEFVYGFPSEGLSVVSYKWWKSDNPEGSNLSDKPELGGGKSDITVVDVDEDSSTGEMAGRSSGEDIANTSPCHRGSQLLRSVRKRVVEEGRAAHKLGVFRGHRGREIGEKEKALLHGIFRSLLPEGWLES